VTSVVEAEVIVLESHPTWIAAQRRESERIEAMRRHPSSQAKQYQSAQAEIRRPAAVNRPIHVRPWLPQLVHPAP
jgi:hypothetical protein